MATLLAIAGGALINALAFSGTNYMFHKLSGDEERRRHDLAVEKTQADHVKWEEERQDRLDFITQRLREQNKAIKDLKNLDQAMFEYYQARKTNSNLPDLKPLRKEPVLSDYYTPSKQQQDAELIFITAALAGLGYVVHRYW